VIRDAASLTIERPVEEVFAFVSDAANEPRWHTDVLAVSATSAGRVGVGSTFRWVVDFMGRKDMDVEVTQLDPGRREVLRARSGPMLPTITYLFEPANGATRFTRQVEVEPRGLMRLMEPMMRGMIGKRNRQFVGNLKRVLETREQP
jgi:uncharacterized protein YndB with AHSA1/START domain